MSDKRTAAATAALIRKAQERRAELLRAHGWVCIPPEDVERYKNRLVDEYRHRRMEDHSVREV
jgi:hypothetical protein